jgi:hypothetical protein
VCGPEATLGDLQLCFSSAGFASYPLSCSLSVHSIAFLLPTLIFILTFTIAPYVSPLTLLSRSPHFLISLSSPLSPRLSFSPLASPFLSSLSSRPYTGGGLSVNYSSDDVTPTFREYSEALSRACPHVFSPLNDGSARRLTIMTGHHTGCALMS